MEQMTYARKIARQIWHAASEIDERGNRGQYRSDLAKIGKQYRDGILYYSRGHGWRVRKDPNWREVFKARFADVYREMTANQSDGDTPE